MKVLGRVLVVIAYIVGMFAIVYYGILPAIGGMWTWSGSGISLVVGLVIAMVLYVMGSFMLGNIKRMQ